MTPTRQGSIHLFRFAGVDLYLHWSWFLVAIYGVSSRGAKYTSMLWPVLEYLALFVIVLIARVRPCAGLPASRRAGEPNRALAAGRRGLRGPAAPARGDALEHRGGAAGERGAGAGSDRAPAAGPRRGLGRVPCPTRTHSSCTVCTINCVLLIFNMLPIYPLDGGQILQSLLWFVLGRARALMATVVIGFVGGRALIVVAIWAHAVWFGILCVFILMNCWRGLMQARVLARIAKLPRRGGFVCPTCQQAPIIGPLWRCDQCGQAFDMFGMHGLCPHCGAQFPVTRCPECGRSAALAEWAAAAPAAMPPRL